MRHARTLINLVLNNFEFLKLITGFGVVGRVFATKGIAPSAEQLKGIDEGALEGCSVLDEERSETRLLETPSILERSQDQWTPRSARHFDELFNGAGNWINGIGDDPIIRKFAVGYVPILRIEYKDDSVDIAIQNLTLSGRNIFPNTVSIEAHNYMTFPLSGAIQDGTVESQHEIKLTLSQIQADL
ncbi:hypothetical protein ARMGADRAFT_1171549 [Armillaria gallica]|uniref:HAM1-like N-terminal domain-containing protein n=1 Tax=Armillaria gallica TaxID=47427 RepID=A0A2H3CYA1_ARMGA|nr:hypothetical protein ARMGADRAFT_1171549 [Armillaria gallica]